MATIKDVARHAGVSHGTVSNVLKGVSSVSLENVLKVERAIRELDYRPDAAARNLKSNRNLAVGVILPNITDQMYAQLYATVEMSLAEHGYVTELYITHEVPDRETEILARAQSRRLTGVILATCQPQNTVRFQEILQSDMKMVFVEREPNQSLDCNAVSCRNDKSVHYATSLLLREGCQPIALITGPEMYSSEQLCEQGYRRALAEAGVDARQACIRTTDLSNQDGFRTAVHLLSLDVPPAAIICTSTELADGVLGALKYVSNGRRPQIVSLSEDKWNDSRYPEVLCLPRACLELGEAAVQLLLENVENAAFYDMKRIHVNNIWVDFEKNREITVQPHSMTIRAAMIEGDIASAVRSMLPDLYRKHGIRVEIDIYPHESLYDLLSQEFEHDRYDVFSVDILWLKEFAENRQLTDLSAMADDAFLDSIDVQHELLNDFARHNGRIYAIPHMYCNQLLFFRKDLFESYSCRRRFYEQHKAELKPPKTWAEFNAVARFFTRQYNPYSETQYGTTLGGRFSSAAFCEYLARFYAYGAEIFDKRGRVTLNSQSAVKALKNYCESYRYASPDSPGYWWHEQVDEFAAGKAAMMMMYSSYVAPLSDRSVSSVVGKTGFCPIPGGRPVLGGWSFGINAKSKKKDAATTFLKWVSAKELAIPLTILGNFSASRTVFESSDIKAIYPWVPESLAQFSNSVRRALPKGKEHLSIKAFEQIVAHAVHESIVGRLSPEDALNQAALEITQLFNEKATDQ